MAIPRSRMLRTRMRKGAPKGRSIARRWMKSPLTEPIRSTRVRDLLCSMKRGAVTAFRMLAAVTAVL
jgi:hypothetical protein